MLDQLKWYSFKATFEARNSVNTSAYTVIDAVVKDVNNLAEIEGEVIFHINDKPLRYKLKKGRQFEATFIFTKSSKAEISSFKERLYEYFNDRWNSRNIMLLDISELVKRDLSSLLSEIKETKLKKANELCLDFLTPLPFKPEHPKKRTYITRQHFIECIISRLKRLYDIDLRLDYEEEDFTIFPCWMYDQLAVSSFSQRGAQRLINGCTGKLYLKGYLESITPLILIASELHAGSAVSYGRGYFKLYSENPVSFIDAEKLNDTIRFYVSKNTNEIGAYTEETVKELYNDFVSGNYEPSPAVAFKDSKTGIIHEQFSWKDRVIASVIKNLIDVPIDSILPLTVVGFRSHTDLDAIKNKIEQLIEQGYEWIADFEIKKLYSSINHKKLKEILGKIIPDADHKIIEIIEKHVKAGYVYDGETKRRDRGIPAGSPLSSILMNLYLIEFDRNLNDRETVLLRYADRCLLFSINEDLLYEKIDDAKELLKNLSLEMDEDRVKIQHYTEGINFVGVKIENYKKETKLRKPLYITETGANISISSNTVNIKDNQDDIHTVPLNRISEIIIVGDTSLTTPFLKKCAKLQIPVIISSSFSSPTIIIQSDGKSRYDTIVNHTAIYSRLSQENILMYAKEIVLQKLCSYEMFFTLKRHLFDGNINQKLKKYRSSIQTSMTLDTLRGYEALAAKEVFRSLNSLIKYNEFHVKTRRRENPDPINSLFNITSNLTFNRIKVILAAFGVNPYLGFLHSSENRYESLVADIQELYRARIDNFIINLINLREIKIADFKESSGAYTLKSSALQRLLIKFEEYLNEPIKGDKSINDCIYQQAQNIKLWIQEQEELKFEIPW